MAMYQNMLVVIDPNQDDQPALRRAVYLHQRIGGKIKAFLPIYDFSYEMTTLLSPDERTAMRQGVISQRTAWIDLAQRGPGAGRSALSYPRPRNDRRAAYL